MLNANQINELDAALRGPLFTPEHEEFDEARRVYNAMIDKRPALIARCADVGDVMAAVNAARDHQVQLSVLGGGHSGPGLGLLDDGVVADLSQMNSVRIDPQARTARVEGGCRIADLDHAAHAFGLATPAGIIANTGVGGLTLGGGHGYLTRKYGLTIDNLLEADVVLADGSFVTTSERQQPELFWALRGGGGNFGIVTSFLFRLHPLRTVHAGVTLWPLERSAEMLRWYRDFLPQAPEDLYGFFAFMEVPPTPQFPQELHGKRVCGCVWCYAGPAEKFEPTFEPVRQSTPIFEHVGEMPYPTLQSLFDPLYPPGLQWYWKGDFVREVSDAAVDVHAEYGSRLPSALSTMHLYPIDGAAHRVAPDATAFSYREANWSMVILGVDPDPAARERVTDWARSYWSALRPHTLGGAYVNFMMEEGEDRVRATYRDNFARLAAIKAQYDPSNLFRNNQNIPPTS